MKVIFNDIKIIIIKIFLTIIFIVIFTPIGLIIRLMNKIYLRELLNNESFRVESKDNKDNYNNLI